MKLIMKNPLVSYFVIVFTIMYAAGLIGIFQLFNVPEIALWIIGSFAPTITAVIVLWITDGKPGIKNLFSKFLIWRVSLKWYFAAASILILSIVIAICYLYFNGLTVPEISIVTFFIMLIMSVILGPLSEEAGWSGYALPRLQAKFSALMSSLILGFLWAIWHAPLWFMPGAAQSSMPIWMFIISLMAIRLIMGWAYNNTNGSLLIAVLFHLFFNFGNGYAVEVLGLPIDTIMYMAGSALVIYAILVVIFTDSENLSRRNEKIQIQNTIL